MIYSRKLLFSRNLESKEVRALKPLFATHDVLIAVKFLYLFDLDDFPKVSYGILKFSQWGSWGA